MNTFDDRHVVINKHKIKLTDSEPESVEWEKEERKKSPSILFLFCCYLVSIQLKWQQQWQNNNKCETFTFTREILIFIVPITIIISIRFNFFLSASLCDGWYKTVTKEKQKIKKANPNRKITCFNVDDSTNQINFHSLAFLSNDDKWSYWIGEMTIQQWQFVFHNLLFISLWFKSKKQNKTKRNNSKSKKQIHVKERTFNSPFN